MPSSCLLVRVNEKTKSLHRRHLGSCHRFWWRPCSALFRLV